MTAFFTFFANTGSDHLALTSVDLYPFLPFWAFVIMIWAMAHLVQAVVLQRITVDAWGLVPVILSLIAFKSGSMTLGALFAASAIIWMVVRLILLSSGLIQKSPSAGGAGIFIWIHASALILMLAALPVYGYLYSRPDLLVQRLSDRSAVIESRLIRLGKKAEKDLISGLSSKDPKTSAACARVLKHLNPPADPALLYPLLMRKDSRSGHSPRIEAAVTLSSIGDESSVEPILNALHENLHYLFKPGKEKLKYNSRFHKAAIKALKEIENRTGAFNGARIAYEKSALSDDPFVVSTWGLIGVELGGTQSLEALQTIFGKIYKDGKLLILESLKDQESSDALNILFMALKDDSDTVRLKSISLLKGRGEMIVIYKLAGALEDNNREVRKAAYEALKTVTGEDLGFNADGSKEENRRTAKKWLLWWAKKVRE